MKAIVLQAYGVLEMLKFEDYPDRIHLSILLGFGRRLLDQLRHFFRVGQHGQMISRNGDRSCLDGRRFVFLELRRNRPVVARDQGP